MLFNRRHFLRVTTGAATYASTAQASLPTRIAALDYAGASTLLSLGLVPDCAAALKDWDKWVVEPQMPKSVVDLGSSWQVNFEALISRKPDLILTSAYQDALKTRLEAIAPIYRDTVYTPDVEDVLPRIVKATRDIAALTGRTGEGEREIAAAEAYFDQCKQRLATLNPPSILIAGMFDERHMTIYSRPGLFHSVLERLGLKNAWAEKGNYWGMQQIAVADLARIRDDHVHLMLFDPLPPNALTKLGQSPIWNALAFSRPQNITRLPPVLLYGHLTAARRLARLLTEALENRA